MPTFQAEIWLDGRRCLMVDRAEYDIASNAFHCPVGYHYGMGTFLMEPGDVPSGSSPVVARFVERDSESAAENAVSLAPLYVVKAEPVEYGAEGTAVQVTVVDVRYVWQKASVINSTYNVLDRATAQEYLPESMETSEYPWTWASMMADIWNRMPGSFSAPTLPSEPASRPYNWTFNGVSAWEAYNAVCERLMVVPVFDPLEGTFRLVSLGADDSQMTSLLNAANQNSLIEANETVAFNTQIIGPAELQVHFPRYEVQHGTENDAGTSDTWAIKPYRWLTRTFTGGSGTVGVHVDCPALVPFDGGTETNNAEMNAVADELKVVIAADVTTPSRRVIARGAIKARGGGRIKSVTWSHWTDQTIGREVFDRGGLRTLIESHPGLPHYDEQRRRLPMSPAYERLRFGNFNRHQYPNTYPQKTQLITISGHNDPVFTELALPDTATSTSPIFHGQVTRVSPDEDAVGQPIASCYVAFINWWHALEFPRVSFGHPTLKYFNTVHQQEKVIGRLNGFREGDAGLLPLYLAHRSRPEDKFTVQLTSSISAASAGSLTGPGTGALLRHRPGGQMVATGLALASIYNSLTCPLSALDVVEVRYVPEAAAGITGQQGHFVVIDRCGTGGTGTPIRAAELYENVDAGSLAEPAGPFRAFLLVCDRQPSDKEVCEDDCNELFGPDGLDDPEDLADCLESCEEYDDSPGDPAWVRQTDANGEDVEITIWNIIERDYKPPGKAVHVYQDPVCTDVWHIIESKATLEPQIALAMVSATAPGQNSVGTLFWFTGDSCDNLDSGTGCVICNWLNYPIPEGMAVVARCMDENGNFITDTESGYSYWHIVEGSWNYKERFVCSVECASGCELIVKKRIDWFNYDDTDVCPQGDADAGIDLLDASGFDPGSDTFVSFDTDTGL